MNTNLPVLGVKKLPPAPKSIRKLIGPSFILIGLGLGTGELILWPYLVSNWGLGIIWGAVLGISMQFFLNMEIERYALVNGESVFVGFYRLKKYLPIWFIFSTLVAWSWPGFSAAAAHVLTPLTGIEDIRWIGIGMLALVGIILTFGPILYKTVESFQKLLILIGVPLIIILVVMLIKASDLMMLSEGIVGIGQGYFLFPKEAFPFMSFLAAFAYSGAGGNLNLAQSFYVKEKGYGMGKYAGRITSLITGKKERIRLTGNTFNGNLSVEKKEFKRWWKLINIEHGLIFWGLGLVTILLLALLSYTTVYGKGGNVEGLNFIFNQANVIKMRAGAVWSALLLIVTSLMLFSTQLAVIDAAGRIVSENIALISGKKIAGSNIPKIYYLSIWILLFFGMIVYLSGFSEPRGLIVLGAVLNAFCMFIFSGMLNSLNTRLLTKIARPSAFRQAAVYVTFGFFAFFSLLTISDYLGFNPLSNTNRTQVMAKNPSDQQLCTQMYDAYRNLNNSTSKNKQLLLQDVINILDSRCELK